eukprot:CAMPEP_0175047360 /NCGR_PEP_ID=MMETSP0052_2-20121109/5546_1 /TAXON_ID=51329 ORGANISM="Polytomella parva, Strain SAG 63-3" /NCGR_SAMPLE_ID=MMETSP0052_2 /ASSEMBLY_ACC=CAM_ASM_000194 /LENGTH=414 /DNA_ID=CAMNT_0016311215 /DNA_START=272 /DNA_END=1513 /DNA_ORIENTATION=+
MFGYMLTIAERFFCPSLELISEYFELPPAVAGATLLAFGNGSTDVFTQLAAMGNDPGATNPDSISVAMSEPLGSGQFIGNVVLALVILASCRTSDELAESSDPLSADPPPTKTEKEAGQSPGYFEPESSHPTSLPSVFKSLPSSKHSSANSLLSIEAPSPSGVLVQRRYFLKDVIFYLIAILAVYLCLLDGYIYLWECISLAALYMVYVLVTVAGAIDDAPVRADPLKHEIPHAPWVLSLFEDQSVMASINSMGSLSLMHLAPSTSFSMLADLDKGDDGEGGCGGGGGGGVEIEGGEGGVGKRDKEGARREATWLEASKGCYSDDSGQQHSRLFCLGEKDPAPPVPAAAATFGSRNGGSSHSAIGSISSSPFVPDFDPLMSLPADQVVIAVGLDPETAGPLMAGGRGVANDITG